MRAVLDSNVLISATLNPHGVPAQVVDAWRDDRYELLLSPQILEEVSEVIQRPKIRARHGWSDAEIAVFLRGLQMFGLVTAGKLQVQVVEEDPDDDKFFACAAEGAADYIVSGDPHLLGVGPYRGVQVVKPRQFLEILAEADEGTEKPE